MRQLFVLSYAAAGPLVGKRLAVFDAAGRLAQATGSTVPIVGAIDSVGAAALDDIVDAHHLGAYPVTAGAAVASGKSVTADAQGRAVQAAAAAGTPVYCVGVSKQAATAAGDEIEIILAPHVLAG